MDSASSQLTDYSNVVAIDGESAGGKGSASKLLAQWMDLPILDSGALYRTVTLMAMRSGISLGAPLVMHEFFRWNIPERMHIRDGVLELDGEPVGDEIRTPKVSAATPHIAENAYVRSLVLPLQRAQAGLKGLIAEGRDMGSEVFPHARVKVYLTASLEVRGARRKRQYDAAGKSMTLAQVMEELQIRDEHDKSRKVCPLKIAEGAVVIDNTFLSPLETALQIARLRDPSFIEPPVAATA